MPFKDPNTIDYPVPSPAVPPARVPGSPLREPVPSHPSAPRHPGLEDVDGRDVHRQADRGGGVYRPRKRW